MKRRFIFMLAAIMIISFFLATGALAVKAGFKTGDEVYTCACGEGCTCNTVSLKPGKCGCGQDLVQGKVTKISAGKMTVAPANGGKAKVFKTSAKYACNCPADCKCATISDKPGKCGCGMDLK
jgi:hypothetical protein